MPEGIESDELLVRYHLGELSQEERDAVEDRLFADDEFHEQVLAAEEELIDSYLRDELTPGQREHFEKWFLPVDDRRERLEFARALRLDLLRFHPGDRLAESEKELAKPQSNSEGQFENLDRRQMAAGLTREAAQQKHSVLRWAGAAAVLALVLIGVPSFTVLGIWESNRTNRGEETASGDSASNQDEKALESLNRQSLEIERLTSEFLWKRPRGTGAPPKVILYGHAPSDTIIGLTLWRLRPPMAADPESARLLVTERTVDAGEQVPVRLSTDTALAKGDRVRLSVEAATSGYLYVISRQDYANGILSDPYVIYPDRLTPINGNRLGPGRPIEVPSREDRPNYFTIRFSHPDQAGEVLTLLITPQPLAEVKVGNQPFPLGTAVYQEWRRRWSGVVEHFELQGRAGQAWTPQEKRAGAGQDTVLTQSDATPQSLYRVGAKGRPVILEIPLRFKK